jgi:hypothetical protein
MSNAIANKRRLLEATQALVKRNDADLDQMRAVSNALAQVFSDMLGVDVELRMRMDAKQVKDAIALADAMEKQRGSTGK